LQAMQKKITQEGKTEEELFKKFMCYCTTNKGDLQDAIAAAETKGPETAAAIEEAQSQHAQLKIEVVAHHADRDSAKRSVADATALREKEAKEFAASDTESNANVKAITAAVAALEKGMGSDAAGPKWAGFLQTNDAQAVLKLVETREAIADVDRQSVLSFLSGEQGYAPQSGQIVGILKQIGDTMGKDAAEAKAAEEEAIQQHDGLVAAKTKEINAHTQAIEVKSLRVGEVAVNAANMKNDLKDTEETLKEDKAFLAELEKGCETKEAEWNERQKTRADELVALAETIKILNDDDALEIFKKSLPSPKTSFVQLGRSTTDVRARALAEVRVARRAATERAPGLDLIALALNSKTMGFEKVTAMIDKMVEVLKSEQQGDDQKKEYCEAEFDQSDDKKKALETKASDEALAAQLAEEGIASLTAEIKALNAGIKELDKAVADATELRKQENADYTELMALDTQAKELLGLAKNRLNQYYNPKLYIPPPKKELTREEAVYQTVVPAEDTPALMQDQAKPAPPPETFEGAYKKKGEATNGVIAMVDMLVADLDKEMTVASTEEKEAQKDYETLMADAKAKRAADSKSVTQKEASKATLEGELQTHKDEKAAADKELAGLSEYISGLHAECDWLLKYFTQRKDARANEVENLNNAKAVLAGADYSLVQLHDKHQLPENVQH